MMEQKSSLDQTSSESFFFFNPRTPCGVRQTGGEITWTRCWFQSTHSLRSATHIPPGSDSSGGCFNPRTPCGVRPFRVISFPALRRFQSTHSLRSATDSTGRSGAEKEFQSTHSLRSATTWAFNMEPVKAVSIHALLAECDQILFICMTKSYGFNPRTPCGVRLSSSYLGNPISIQFQSTHSLRSATTYDCRQTARRGVSIHALLAECDCARPYTLLLNRANHTLRQPP